MQKEDCFLVGTIFKLHGYKGYVKIYNKENTPFDFSLLTFLLIELDNKLVPFFIDDARSITSDVILVKFEDINSKENAKKILKKRIFASKKLASQNKITKKPEEKLIGYSVIDNKMGYLGKVIRINTQTIQKLIYVEKDTKEFCFPLHKEFVKEIKKKEEIIQIEISIELLNLN